MKSVVLIVGVAIHLSLAQYTNFIVGGYDADITDHQYQGSLRFLGEHSCGCVLVSSTWIVSAAHCGGGLFFTVMFGQTDRRQGKGIPVKSVTIHPQYMSGDGVFPNDISVIQLAYAAEGSNIKPIAIGQSRLDGGQRATITGWGRTCGYCGVPIYLRAAKLDVLSDAECHAHFKEDYNPQGHVCVMDVTYKRHGGCSGDSGGPMISGNEVHGVTSFGLSTCSPEAPSVYTRLTTYRPWICQLSSNQTLGC